MDPLLETLEEIEKHSLDNDDVKLFELAEKAKSIAKERYNDYNGLVKKYEIQKQQLQILEETIEVLKNDNDLLRQNVMKPYQSFQNVCEQKYKQVWELLTEESKIYLMMANYLFHIGANNKDKIIDFSPVVIELCRVFENELGTKIFNPYIEKKKNEDELQPSDIGDSLYDAVMSFKDYGNYFLSMKEMIINLSLLKNNYDFDTYIGDLKVELKKENWDLYKLADYSFCKKGKDYTNNMRNKAAHPGQVLDKDFAANCNKVTKELLTEFITSKVWN